MVLWLLQRQTWIRKQAFDPVFGRECCVQWRQDWWHYRWSERRRSRTQRHVCPHHFLNSLRHCDVIPCCVRVHWCVVDRPLMKTKTEVTRRKTEVSYFRWRHTFSPIFFQLFNLFRRSSREWSLEGEDGAATCWWEDITSHHPASRRSVLLVRVSVLTLGDGSRVCIMLTHFGIDCFVSEKRCQLWRSFRVARRDQLRGSAHLRSAPSWRSHAKASYGSV